VELKVHEFPVMVPVTESATMDLDGGRVEKIYPFWPAQVRVCATPAEGIAGKLVYVGECRYDQLRPASLAGQIAVVEASTGENWTQAFYFGARAAIILGKPDTTWADLESHELRIPINLPRFYVPPGKLADELRNGAIDHATLKASVSWQRVMARNLYALVHPAKRTPDGWSQSKPPATLMFSVPYDSSSLVPDLSPGASQAAQAACGLALLRDLSKHPWDRPVVLFFSGADSIQFLGTRNMFLALAVSPATWRDEIAGIDEQTRSVQQQLKRATEVMSSPQSLSIRDDRALIDRISKSIESDLAEDQDQLFRLRSESNDADAINQLEQRQITFNKLKSAFELAPAQLADPALKENAQEYLSRVIQRVGPESGLLKQYESRRAELNQRIDLYHWLADAVGRTTDPDPKQIDARLIELLVGLDLSDHGTRVGPMYWGFFQRNNAMAQVQEYGEWLTKHERDFPAIDFEPMHQLRSPSTYLAAPLPIPSELSQAFITPGLSMVTLNDLRLRRDTPNDTLDGIHVDAIFPQLIAVRDLFALACADARFHGPAEVKRQEITLTGQVVSASGARPMPDLPREGFLATYSYIANKLKDRKIPQLGLMLPPIGIRRSEVCNCDADGYYRFEGLPRLRPDKQEGAADLQNDMQTVAVLAYKLEPKTGAIVATTDLGKQAGDLKASVDFKLDFLPVTSVVFDCEEFGLTGLYDPRYLQSLGEIIPLDARRDAEPQRYSMILGDEMLAGFVEPGSRSDLLIRYGKIGNRLVVLNSQADGKAAGYDAHELNRVGPISLATSRDFYRLDDQRLKDYRRAGVSSELVDALHRESGQQLSDAQVALVRDDGVSFIRDCTGAWANEARVYDAAQSMARDVIRAAIFLLMLCVPFAFVMERLLIGTPNVYRQIASACGIFAVMTLALVSFHPAFKISASPLIIILSFAIILMSCLVIGVVYSKFDVELKRLRSGRGVAPGSSFASAGVMMSAVLLGIANMRKRKFRTLLTSITIVLITFAVLCFTSSTHYVGTTTTPTGVAASHPGIMLRQRGYRPIPPILPAQLRTVLADPELKIGNINVVERWWAVSAAEPKEQFNLVGPKRTLAVPAVLGLSPGESALSKIGEIVGSAQFARLENGERNLIYLSSATADSLGVKQGDRVRLGGIDLEVAGVFDANRFDREVTTLSGESIAPLRYSAGQVDANGKPIDDTAVESLEVEGGGDSRETYEHLSSSQFVIVPAPLCRMLQHAQLRSVGLRLENEDQVKRVSEALSRRFALAMFAGYDDGVRMVAASNLSSVSGASQVAIPLAIVGLIIFNTMMGSIAERRREIHVYTSLGLAPLHVGALFVAEAMTYGLIGVVFGYVIGQGAGTAMQRLGWLGSATLNYSGTSAMMTMGLILLIVFISALVPARLASKIAAPSIDRTWQVPEPKDDQILAVLPFTINKTAAEGALAYIADFFDAHKEGTIGKFSAGQVEAFRPDNNGSRGLRTDVWLTPFDLGVRQHLALLIHPGEFPDIYEVEVVLKRISGDEGSWHRLNRTFLTELRKQFLQWRSLTPAKMMEYVEQSKRLFGTSSHRGDAEIAEKSI
jgi:ABC-type lipoprotein release transport system permease subunit